MRKIIFHYHLFKNAGTSVDQMLKSNFGDCWVTREFEGNPEPIARETAAWINEQPQAMAFSSHTALLPPPNITGVEVYPVVFVRHPIDRIASIYAFERNQEGDGFGTVLARNTTLGGYIDVRLSLWYDRQCRDFHCKRLGYLFKADTGTEPERALRAIEALPFIGLVEAYDDSIRRMAAWLKPHFPEIEPIIVARNVSRDRHVPLADRLSEIKREIGEVTYARLLDANANDLKVFEAVSALYDG